MSFANMAVIWHQRACEITLYLVFLAAFLYVKSSNEPEEKYG